MGPRWPTPFAEQRTCDRGRPIVLWCGTLVLRCNIHKCGEAGERLNRPGCIACEFQTESRLSRWEGRPLGTSSLDYSNEEGVCPLCSIPVGSFTFEPGGCAEVGEACSWSW
jgi:hypothetical protein